MVICNCIKALFNIALKKFAKMFSTKRKTKDLVAVRNMKCMYLNPTYLQLHTLLSNKSAFFTLFRYVTTTPNITREGFFDWMNYFLSNGNLCYILSENTEVSLLQPRQISIHVNIVNNEILTQNAT